MDGKVIIGTELDTKHFDRQIDALEDKLDDLEHQKIYFEAQGMTGELKDVEKEIEITSNKIVGLQKQKAKLEEKSSMGLSDVLKQSSSQLEGIISKVGRWALAVFSVRSAYNLVRQASSTLAQYNEQYATNLEYIRYALAQAIAPVLEYVVNLAYKLLSFIGAILNALFGINVFSKASAKNFANAKKSLGGANKSAKELQKTLAGFDEMNILNSSSTGGGGGVGAIIPSIDFLESGNIEETFTNLNEKVEGFIEKLKKSREEAIEILNTTDLPPLLIKGFELASEGAINIVEGLIETIKGFFKIIWGLLTQDWDLIKKGFSDLFFGILQVLGGTLEVALGYIEIAVGAIWELIKALVKMIWDIISFTLGEIWKVIKAVVWDNNVKLLIDLYNAVKGILDGILQIFRGDFKNGIITIGKSIANIIISILNAVINNINAIIEPIRSLVKQAGKIAGTNWNISNVRIPNIPMLATGAILNQPGRGVPLGIAGERGQEGLIPLTDNQAMETLGQAIGRYITINASITNTMNGRVLSRELKKISNVENFAFNS